MCAALRFSSQSRRAAFDSDLCDLVMSRVSRASVTVHSSELLVMCELYIIAFDIPEDMETF